MDIVVTRKRNDPPADRNPREVSHATMGGDDENGKQTLPNGPVRRPKALI